jgi:sarcosine oxidase subunit alpha
MKVETQNVLGTAKRDLLAATDWFFPKGMDHHHMFTRFGSLNRAMQNVARRIAGIGRLPEAARLPSDWREARCQVLIVGGGAAGLGVATECARAGLDTVVVDERPTLGGSLALFPGREHEARELVESAAKAGARLLPAHVVLGVYDQEPFVLGPDGPSRFSADRLVIATGAASAGFAAEGSDLPGVIEARGAATLLSFGVVAGDRVVLVGQGPWLEVLARSLSEAGAEVLETLPESSVVRVRGKRAVENLEVREGNGSRTLSCDAVIYDLAQTANYEIATQSGASVEWVNDGFIVQAREDGTTGRVSVRAVGACAGVFDLGRVQAQARAAGLGIAAELGGDRA